MGTRIVLVLASLVTTIPFCHGQLVPEPGQDLWQWHGAFVANPNNLIGAGEEGGSLELHEQSMAFWGKRLYPTGDFQLSRAAIAEYMTWIEGHPKGGGGFVSNWSCMGPFDLPTHESPAGSNVEGTGQIHAIAFDPNYATNGVMYCASAYGGMFKRDGFNAVWVNMTDHALPIIGITDIVIDPQNPTHLFIATGNVDSPHGYTAGVFRSFNGGETWNAINNGLLNSTAEFIGMHAIEMSPFDSNELLCLTSGGIFRCANASAADPDDVQWTYSASSPADGNFKSLVYHPVLQGMVYASGSNFYVSPDGGTTWGTMNASFLNNVPFLLNPCERIAISIAQEAPYKLHATIRRAGSSTGYAAYFDQVAQQWFLGASLSATAWTSKAWCCNATSPVNGNMVAYGTTIMHFSQDNGSSVFEADGYTEEAHPDKHVLAFVKLSDTEAELWVGHDGGLSKTTTLSAANAQQCVFTEESDGLVTGTILAISSSPTHPDQIWIGNQDVGNSVLLSREQGVHDWRTKQGGDGGAVLFSPDGDKAWTQMYNARKRFIKWRLSLGDYVDYDYEGSAGPPPSTNYMGAFGASEIPPMGFSGETGQWWLGVSDIWSENDIQALPTSAASFTRVSQIQCDLDAAQNQEYDNCAAWGHTNTIIHPADDRFIYFTRTYRGPDPAIVDCPDGIPMRLYRSVVNGGNPLPALCDQQPRFELATLPTTVPVSALVADPADPNHIWQPFRATTRIIRSGTRSTEERTGCRMVTRAGCRILR